MPCSNRHLIVLLTLGVSVAVASCGSPAEHSASGTALAGASGSALEPGASGSTQGGQLGQGGRGMGGAGTGGTVLGGAAGGGGAPSGGATSREPNFVKTRLNAEFYSEGINYG